MNTTTISTMPSILLPTNPFFFSPNPNPNPPLLRLRCHHSSILASASCNADRNPSSTPNSKPRRIRNRKQPSTSSPPPPDGIPTTIPPKPLRGRRGEAAAVEDFVRASLERTFESIRRQNGSVLEGKGEVLRERLRDDEGMKDEEKGEEEAMVVEEEREGWPLDAEIGWGVRASEYFDQHPIKNVVGEDGVEIDWVGEVDEGLVKEINCLEWESFAFHPSPLIVLVFERYNRATDNWKLLKELEKAAKVYWSAKDRLPPRTIKIDINIETDLAYALKVKECPQLLFLRGNRILYREKELRTSEELVQMIAHFYYNAKRPSCVDPAAVAFAPPFCTAILSFLFSLIFFPFIYRCKHLL